MVRKWATRLTRPNDIAMVDPACGKTEAAKSGGRFIA
jgi:hypothetical protein